MAGTRERSLDAALELLGTQGLRALTHARVDAFAGLPAGSTSNWFRSRQALVAGVVAHLAAREQADLATGDVPRFSTAAELSEGFCAMLELQAGPFQARTRARYALFLEAATDAELAAPLVEARRGFEVWTATFLAALNSPSPSEDAHALMALGEGLLLHRLTVDPTVDFRPAVERMVGAILGSGAEPA